MKAMFDCQATNKIQEKYEQSYRLQHMKKEVSTK